MTEDDIREAQSMIEDTVQQINSLNDTVKALQKTVVQYQKFVVNHITGEK